MEVRSRQSSGFSDTATERTLASLRDSLGDVSNLQHTLMNKMDRLEMFLTTSSTREEFRMATSLLFEHIRNELIIKTQLLEVAVATKHDQNTKIILERLDIIQPKVIQSDTNITTIMETMEEIEDSIKKLISKIDLLLLVISVSFILCMAVWGIISFFFNSNLPPGNK